MPRSKEEREASPGRHFSGHTRSPEGVNKQREYLRTRQQARRAKWKGNELSEIAVFLCDVEGCNRRFSTQRGVSMHKTWMHN